MLYLESLFTEALSRHLTVVHQLDTQRQRLEKIASRMTDALLRGKRVLWCGNGGSASDAQHLAGRIVAAGELVIIVRRSGDCAARVCRECSQSLPQR